jgi:hypothetical protein
MDHTRAPAMNRLAWGQQLCAAYESKRSNDEGGQQIEALLVRSMHETTYLQLRHTRPSRMSCCARLNKRWKCNDDGLCARSREATPPGDCSLLVSSRLAAPSPKSQVTRYPHAAWWKGLIYIDRVVWRKEDELPVSCLRGEMMSGRDTASHGSAEETYPTTA